MLWRLKFRSLWNRSLGQDLDDELRSHIELKAEELQAQGLTALEAGRQARLSFGNFTRAQENTREVHVFTLLESWLQDVRYGFRRLRREPAFALAAVLTLGLVIGANGAIFSVLEAILLRPLPFTNPDRLVVLFGTSNQSQRETIAAADLDDLAKAPSLAALAAQQTQSVNLTGVDEPGRLIGGFVSASYFPTLGIQPAKGRGFSPDEDKPGSARVCLLSHGVWLGRFGGDPGTLGHSLILNAEPYTVIGILPETFRATFTNAEVWIPVQYYPNYSRERGRGSVTAVGRLADRATVEQARAELDTIAQQLAAQFPATNRNRGVAVHAAQELLVGSIRNTLAVLAGAAGFVLLIGCANIAGLLLTKTAGRKQEMAIRGSLGASRGRLARQLLIECLLLAAGGGMLGIALASWGMHLLTLYCADLVGSAELKINSTVMLFLAGASVVTGLLFGMAPAFAARRQTANALTQRGAGAGRSGFRSILVAAQVALALVLLIGAGLMVKSLNKIASIDPGFRGERVLTMEYRVPRNKYSTGAQQTQFHHSVVARVAALPGVESAGLVGALPFSGNRQTTRITLPDRPEPPADAPFIVQSNTATPSYFGTVGIPLLAGRDFLLSDGPDSQPVGIINKTFAERFWPGQNPLGRQIKVPGSGQAVVGVTITGVVGNTKHDSLDDADEAQLYFPYAQSPFIFATLAVRTKGDPLAMTKGVQHAIWSIDKDQPMWKIRTLQSLVDRSFSYRRYVVYLLSCFSALALGLAAIGLYGVLAYSVSQRSAEFGIRMAIGAQRLDILRMVVGKGLLLTGYGLVAGVISALVLSRFLRTQVYDVSTSDPAVYGALSAVLLAVALLAVLIPALRAMRVDPVVAIRQE